MPINYDDAQYTNELGDPINATDAAESTPAIAIPKPGTPAAVVPDAETDYANEMKRIREEMKTNKSASRATVDDMVRAQAIEGVMSGIIKAFAGARGLKTGRDLSGVDVKTGIDWNAAMNGKLGILRDEAAALRGEQSDIGQGLSARLRARSEGAKATALAGQQAVTNEQRSTQLEQTKTFQERRLALEAADLRRKTDADNAKAAADKAKADKDNIGGSMTATVTATGREIAGMEKTSEKLDAYVSDMASDDEGKAKVAEAHLRALLISKGGMDPTKVTEMTRGELGLARQKIATGMDRDVRAAEAIHAALLRANETKSKEDHAAAVTLSTLGKGRIDPDAPMGTVTAKLPTGQARAAALKSVGVDKLKKIESENSSTFKIDEPWVDVLQSVLKGKKVSPDDLDLLPDYLFERVPESYVVPGDEEATRIKRDTLMKQPGARLGVAKP